MELFWENIIKLGLYVFPYIEPYIIYVYKHVEFWYTKKPIIIEPTTSEWINICSLVIIAKKYQLVNTNIIQTENVKKEYYSFYKSFYSNYEYLENENENENLEKEDITITKEHLFIARLKNNKYICKVCFSKHVKYMFDYQEEDEEEEEADLDTSLLYVEYSHPKMTTSISLPFSKHIIQPFNELFTPAFVFRQLQTQTEYYYFDMDYSLTILDSNLNRVLLNSTQYILWQPNPDNYTIIQR